MNPEDNEKLERWVHRALRDLPDRHAPGSLEARVLGAIASRQAMPWWHRSYLSWPAPARGAFLVLSSLAALLLLLPFAVDLGALAIVGRADAVLDALRETAGALLVAAGAMARAVGPYVIYGAIAAFFTLYVTLFGIGAAAYRLFVRDSFPRIP